MSHSDKNYTNTDKNYTNTDKNYTNTDKKRRVWKNFCSFLDLLLSITADDQLSWGMKLSLPASKNMIEEKFKNLFSKKYFCGRYEILSTRWQLGEYFLSGENRIQSQPLIQDIKLSVAPNFMKGITNYTSNIFVNKLQTMS